MKASDRIILQAMIGAALVLSAGGGGDLLTAQTPNPQSPQTRRPGTQGQQPSAQPKPAAKESAEEETIPPAAPDAMFPAVVARVNGKAILGRDLEQRIYAELAQIGSPKWNNLKEDYRQELIQESLGSLIGAELIYQKAVASGLKATEAETKSEFEKFSKSFPNDAEMNRVLASRGLDRQALTRELSKGLTVSKFVTQVVSKKITVSPAEVSRYYQENTEEFRHPDLVRTSHILIMVPQGAAGESDRLARERAESVLARLKSGEDFAKLAKEYSTDSSASQGGDIGMTPRGQLVPEYEAAAFSLPVGGVSNLVRTSYGYHIIKVTDKKSAGTASFADVQEQLKEFLQAQKTDLEMQKLVAELGSQANIESLIPVTITPNAEDPRVSSPRP